MAPAAERVRPAGNAPLAREYVNVPDPPVAATEAVYAALYVAAARVVGKTMAGAALIVRASLAVAVRGVAVPESVIWNVRLLVPTPAANGVPVMAPAEVMVRPVGNVPLAILKE